MKQAYLVQGLGYGDEGKGATVDYLTRKHKAQLVCRFNGGPQTAHNVVTPEGVHHTFRQFGSGTFAGARTFLSRFMLVNPLTMLAESSELEGASLRWFDPLSFVAVSADSVVITPYQIELQRAILRHSQRFASCGEGVGQARGHQLAYGSDVLFVGDIISKSALQAKLDFIQNVCENDGASLDITIPKIDRELVVRSYERWFDRIELVTDDEDYVNAFHTVIFEGAQGVLLDQTHGEEGFNTWTDCTFDNADILSKYFSRQKIGVLRTYHTRHGDGPLPGERDDLNYQDAHNGTGRYQGRFRVAPFNLELARRGLDIIGGVDGLAINHADVVPPIEGLEEKLGVEMWYISDGPTANHRTALMEVTC